MKVLKSKRSGNIIHLEIEASHDEIESKMDGAFKRVSKKAALPGFRKGKVPRKLFEKEYGKEYIIQEAVNDTINETYKNALEELKLSVVDYPKNIDVDEYKENKSIKYRCDVEVEPEIKLKKYKGLKVDFTEKTADDEALQMELDTLVNMYGTYESVDRAAANEDIVRFNSTVTIDEQPFELWSRENQATRLGLANYGETFDTEVTGLKTGDKKSFTVSYPDDFKTQEVAGKTLAFDVEVSEVREKTLPELTDELAKKIEKTCETVDQLKDHVRKQINDRYETENKNKKEDLIFDALVSENDFELPNAMVEQEINFSLYQFEYSLRQQGMDMKQYQEITKKSAEEMKADLREPSEKRVKLRLILEAIIKKEKIEVSDDDIQSEIDAWKHDTIKTIDDLKNSKEHNIDTLKNNLIDQKVRELLVSSAKIK